MQVCLRRCLSFSHFKGRCLLSLCSSAPVSPSICIQHYITVVPTYGHCTLTQFEVPAGFVPCLPDQLHSLPPRSIRKSCRALSLHAPALPLLPVIMPELQHHSLVLWYLNNLLFIYLFWKGGGILWAISPSCRDLCKDRFGSESAFCVEATPGPMHLGWPIPQQSQLIVGVCVSVCVCVQTGLHVSAHRAELTFSTGRRWPWLHSWRWLCRKLQNRPDRVYNTFQIAGKCLKKGLKLELGGLIQNIDTKFVSGLDRHYCVQVGNTAKKYHDTLFNISIRISRMIFHIFSFLYWTHPNKCITSKQFFYVRLYIVIRIKYIFTYTFIQNV